MFYIILVLFFCGLGSLLMYFDRNNGERFKEGHYAFFYSLGGWVIFLGGMLLLIGLFDNLWSYSNQKRLFENIRSEQQSMLIMEQRFIDLRSEFAKNLGEKYPELEKNIFEKMAPQDADQLKFYFVQYPELKSATTLNYLVEQIKSIADDWYNKQLLLQKLYAEARYRVVSPWLIFQAEIPADLYLSIYPK